MNEHIVIPVKIQKLKTVTRWTLETATWLIGAVMLAASAAVAAGSALVWLIWGSDTILAAGLTGSLLLGLAGIWQLIRKIEAAVHQLRSHPLER